MILLFYENWIQVLTRSIDRSWSLINYLGRNYQNSHHELAKKLRKGGVSEAYRLTTVRGLKEQPGGEEALG